MDRHRDRQTDARDHYTFRVLYDSRENVTSDDCLVDGDYSAAVPCGAVVLSEARMCPAVSDTLHSFDSMPF